MPHDLNDTLVFVKVVEQGSFIAAAKSLGLPKTTVSRKVQELEMRLGAQLLHRTTRRLGVTEAGGVYYEHCQRIAQELEEAESAVGQLQGGPRGWLRFTVPYSIGISWISPLLGEFHAQYPDLRLDMHMSNDPVELIGSDFDLALRAGNLPDSTLVARRLAGFRTQVFASPHYIERHGEPLHPEELQHHRIIAVRKHYHAHPSRITWPLSDGSRTVDFPINPLMVANDPSALIGAVLCGEGLTPGYRRRRQALRRSRRPAPGAGRLDRAGGGPERGVPAWAGDVAQGPCLRRLPRRAAQLQRRLHDGALPLVAVRRRAGRRRGGRANGRRRRREHAARRQADPEQVVA